jgi:excisionase family DNA binding protein
VMTLAEVLSLPAMVTLEHAARALRIGRTTAYELAQKGEFPVLVHRVGKKYLVPTAPLLRFLGVGEAAV